MAPDKLSNIKRWLLGAALLILPAAGLLVVVNRYAGGSRVDFNADIRPILNANCTVCHGGVKREAGLSLLFRSDALREAESGRRAIVPGRSRESELLRRVRQPDPRHRMPLDGEPLTSEEIRKLERWINQGAQWGDHWAYVPPRMAELPAVSDPNWPRNGIDHFILARLDREMMKSSAPADCAILIRRLSLDLVGLPPDPGVIEAFCENPSETAYAAIVEDLLASPRFGERWAAMWLDLARYADTQGYEKDLHRTIWKYRDWVIRAFNNDLPFDRFTIEQLAGDLLPDASQEQLIATAFHRNTMTNTEGGTKDEEFRISAVVDRVNTTMEAWQGTTFQCAQCHNHPYDPIRQTEYYGVFAFFNNTRDADRADEFPVLATFRDPEKRIQGQRILEESRQIEREMESLAAQPEVLQNLEEWVLGAREALRFSDGRDLIGVKQIPPESELEEIIRRAPEEREPYQQRVLLEHYKSFAPEFRELSRGLRDRRQELRKLEPILTPVLEELPVQHHRVTRVLERGNWLVQGEEIRPGVPEVLNSFPEDATLDRLSFARWLTSSENPLTGRVVVNRFWHELFGIGIVETLEDFGTQGAGPTHPDLLDWLAVRFVDELGWSVKRLLREIVLSATYRQTSLVSDESFRRDPHNRFLGRGPRFRLSAEQIRDQALAVAGLLSPKMYGPSVMPPQPAGIWNSPYGEKEKWIESEGEDRYRRAVYTYWKRTSPFPSMVIFDSPTREVTVSRRIRTSTPLQALVTLNDPVYVEAAHGLAARMHGAASESIREQISRGYRRALGRNPDDATLEDLQGLYEEALTHFRDRPAELRLFAGQVAGGRQEPTPAALAVVAAAIMNLDEFLNKE